ncbi:hypothetical protein BpHYR1_050321 [Brachionus plicatilis]|uniref:Uncharacterized protein n=1 Tax=Brachionus plicatilis TaxID=10195 RepID=A0A3M7SCH5_BRAPC|nr:hypothetical protein BpHYR1_050321 [Brachionus plicatilis]
MNGFNDWTSIHPVFKHDKERVKQIKDLIEDKYPKALQNIDKAKTSQIKAQNNIGCNRDLNIYLLKGLDPRYETERKITNFRSRD